MSRIATLIALLFLLVTPAPSSAVFHIAHIGEVMSGVNGDPSVQYVEIRMNATDQNGVLNTFLTAFNCAGTAHSVLLQVSSNVLNSGVDTRFIMATNSFAALAGITPDFTWDPALTGNIDPQCGMVCWGARGFLAPSMPDTGNPNNYVDCVGYGGYGGPTKTDTHDGTPTSGIATGLLPGDGTMSLTRMAFSGSNLAYFALASPTPTNNAGAVGSFSAGTTTTTTISSTTTSEPGDTTSTTATSSSTTIEGPTTSVTATSSSTTTAPRATATTTSSTSTTTVPPDACAEPLACDDGDACSVDGCVAGAGCVHDPVASAADLVRIGPTCAGQPVPASVGQQFARGCGFVESAKGQATKKAKGLLTKATKAFKRAAKAAAAAGRRKKNPVSGECTTTLGAIVGNARDQALRAKSGL
jgi:hypothetical protein